MVGTQRGTHVGDKVCMGQTPVELELFASIGRVEGRVIPGAIGRCAGVDRAILSTIEIGIRQRGSHEEITRQKVSETHGDWCLGRMERVELASPFEL